MTGIDSQNLPISKDGLIRRGFGLKDAIADELDELYVSDIVQRIRDNDYQWEVNGLRFRLAREFGFCYGVDKAIDLSFETRRRFPDRRLFLTNEIIHNPRVNHRLLEMGYQFLQGQYAAGNELDSIRPEDVVVLPAFGIEQRLLARLRQIGCILVDTTCGSVVHVWKRVERYAREGFTSIIHGKWRHEETVATCSHVTQHPGAHYLVVFDKAETERVCDVIRTGRVSEQLARDFVSAASPGFRFDQHLSRIGFANQTTMLSSESLEIAEMIRQAMIDRHGAAYAAENFRSFDTICNATQERQDAIKEMMQHPPDLMLVIGGFNSSNTGHLCELTAPHCPTYHVDDVQRLISPTAIEHKPPMAHDLVVTHDWLPPRRPLEIGLTAGASTPNRVIGEIIERILSWSS